MKGSFLDALALSVEQALPVVKLPAFFASVGFSQFEGEDFDWIIAFGTDVALLFLADFASVEMAAEYFIVFL